MNKIEFGDCRETMRKWAAEGVKVQTCVTSPPYFGLRDYGTANWTGGDVNCDHVESENKHGGQRADRNQEGYKKQFKSLCKKCGAVREDKQLGLEQTPEQYIAAMVEVFRCVRDVLADDGTLWLNIGDSYGSGKQLLGIPWRMALALQADNWVLRQDIIWHKPNPMPESVRDRCTKAHEYIFLLSKSEKYFFDNKAMREDSVDPIGSAARYKTPFWENGKHQTGNYSANGAKHTGGMKEFDGKRNKRSVWTVNTKPYKGAHFATFPTTLIEPCILAGSRPGDIVLDPFMGSGTTAAVAVQHGRQYLGCELNPEYGALQEQRLQPPVKPKKVVTPQRCPKTMDLFEECYDL